MGGFVRTKFNALTKAPKVVEENATNEQIGMYWGIPDGSRLRIDIIFVSADVTTGVTAKLQVSPGTDENGDLIWLDSKSATVTNNAQVVSIRINPETETDQQYLPFPGNGRVVMTTGADDEVVVHAVNVWREWN